MVAEGWRQCTRQGWEEHLAGWGMLMATASHGNGSHGGCRNHAPEPRPVSGKRECFLQPDLWACGTAFLGPHGNLNA